ncbi:hypothetical protein [Mesorhizobium denitrificans]|uniref:Uncharacterized protein n=1 Tax=Mesorhizobium denitrificans TaxID=2294114 RepID=A0A371XGH8_9HYPH|nr:hypothetical protein [Mesorhizobium denitrificans]RFC68339.1 hypothetical protein DY251_04985 [Mesorhizobium denitrificans]
MAKTAQAPAKPYEPTPRENKALSAFELRRQNTIPTPVMKATKKGKDLRIAPDHEDKETGYKLIMEAIGTADPDFVQIALEQLTKLAIPGATAPCTPEALNASLALVRGIRPQDEVEAMLAIQMSAIHMATMTTAARLSVAKEVTWIELHEKALNKLARTFTTQIEALKRYRSKGEQKVTVEHVTVNEGGQAIVGTVTQGGGV